MTVLGESTSSSGTHEDPLISPISGTQADAAYVRVVTCIETGWVIDQLELELENVSRVAK